MHRTSVTNIVDKLEADGLVRRVAARAEDRRATLAEITDAGRDAAAARDRGAQRRRRSASARSTTASRRRVTELLRTPARRRRGLHRRRVSGPVPSVRPRYEEVRLSAMATTHTVPTRPTAEWREAYALTPERDVAVHDARGRADQAALHRGGPAGAGRRSASPAAIRSRAACTRACTAAACGRCASSPASAPPRRPTSASATCSTTARPGLSTAFDMPSLMGHDSDHARSLGEVGREGVAIDTLDDMEDAVRRHRPRRGQRVDDDQRARGDHARLLRRRRRAAGRSAPSTSPARSRPTSSRSTSPRRSGASRSTRRCACSAT